MLASDVNGAGIVQRLAGQALGFVAEAKGKSQSALGRRVDYSAVLGRAVG